MTLVQQCLELLQRKDVKLEIKAILSPITEYILRELHIYIYVIVGFFTLIFLMIFIILILLVMLFLQRHNHVLFVGAPTGGVGVTS